MYMKDKKLDYSHPDYPIPESMNALFDDLTDILHTELLGLEDSQIELALEMIANQIFNNYAVLYGPTTTHLTLQ